MIFFISRSWWFLRCHWYRWNGFRGVIDTAEFVSAVSLTSNNVDYFGEYEAICETVLACESGPWVGLIGGKTRGRKSRDTVPLSPKTVNWSCYCIDGRPLLQSNLHTVEKYPSFSYNILYIFLKCWEQFYQCVNFGTFRLSLFTFPNSFT
jgi:hypothetical protein